MFPPVQTGRYAIENLVALSGLSSNGHQLNNHRLNFAFGQPTRVLFGLFVPY